VAGLDPLSFFFLGRHRRAAKEDPLNGHGVLTRALSIFLLVVVMATTGCYDPDAGTITADRATREALVRSVSDAPPKPSRSRSKRPDFNDVSPGPRGEKGKP
jgi:hypothetical protein